jgi:2-phospho-L-lactate guanylyltransferase
VSVTAIVPLKALAYSKQRLAPHLSAAERSALMRRLFAGVLHACRAADAVDQVIAVVGDDTGLGLARDAGVVALRERGAGLNAAIAFATTHVRAGNGSLVVVADLPDVGAADLDAVVAAGANQLCVLVAATDDGGTGALLRRPAAVIPPAFGQRSAAAHLTAAQRAGVRAVRLSLPGFARDIDAAADLSKPPPAWPGRAVASDL